MRILALVGFLAIVGVVATAVFFFGGFYNVAASAPDPGIVAWAIERVRIASIDRHAAAGPPTSLDDPVLIQAGARAFAGRGCTYCHGAPGVKWAHFSEGLRPDPPDLAKQAPEPRQVFWVVKNGIRMTGMPSFGAIGVEDQEIWSITAFVRKLPLISEADFKTWTADATTPPKP